MRFWKTAETKEGDATAYTRAERTFSLSMKRLLVKPPRQQQLQQQSRLELQAQQQKQQKPVQL